MTSLNFKLCLLGSASVGKSSLVERFVKNEFFEFQQPTIGASFLTQIVRLEQDIIKFEIWDTAGQERYHSLAPMYYRGAAAALVGYDITSSESFQRAQTWVEELLRQGSTDIVIGIAGNKVDLSDRREVTYDEGKEYADANNCIFFETSAKTGENVNEIFRAIAERLPRHQEPVSNDTIQIINADSSGSRCC